MIDILKKEIEKNFNIINTLEVNPDIFIFESKIKLFCFHCKNYNKKWTCPNKIPDLNYESIFKQYKNGLLLYCMIPFKEDFEKQRIFSTNILHKALLHLEKILWDNNFFLRISFIGGSCKLCKSCGVTECSNKDKSRIPLEALGINVVDSLKKVGIEIKFPIIDKINRYGVLLW